LPHAF